MLKTIIQEKQTLLRHILVKLLELKEQKKI